MPAIKLTAAYCESVRPVSGRQIAYPDRDAKGLELRVSGDGRKSWSFRYRTRDGRQGRITLGLFTSEFGLADARLEARKAQVAIDGGGDPAEMRRLARVEARTEHLRTFGDLAEAYFAATEAGRYRPRRPNSLKNERAVYRVHIEKTLGRLRLESITRRTVKDALERLLDKGVTSQAIRAQAVIRQMLTYAVAEERLPHNPVADLSPVAASKARSRTYSDAELRAIWHGVADPTRLEVPAAHVAGRRDGTHIFVGRPMQLALQLVFLLLQRRSEVLGMSRSELDLANGVWTVPAERMKNKRPHAVPLSVNAVALIREAIDLNDDRRIDFVFPNRIDDKRPMNGPSMNHALSGVLLALGIENGTIHDIRRTGSTLMTSERLGISPFIRSKVLSHTDAGGGSQISATHYDANSYLGEKRRALEAWQGLLSEIVG